MDTTPKKRTLGDDFRDYLNGKIENKYYGGVRREFTGISDTTAIAFGKRRNNQVKELDAVTDEEGNLTLENKDTKQNRLSGSSLPLAGDEIKSAQERALNKRKNDPATVPSYEQYIQRLADTYVVQTVPSKEQIQQYNADSKMLFEGDMQEKYNGADYNTLMNASDKTESYREKQWLKSKVQEIATSSDLQGEKDDLIKQIDELANEIQTAKPLEQDKLVKQREELQQKLYNLEVNGIDTKIKDKKSIEDSEEFEKWKNKYEGYTYEELLKAQDQATDDKEKQRLNDYAYEIGSSGELTAHRDKLKAEYDKLYSEINSYDDKKHDEALKHMMNIEDELEELDNQIKSKKYEEDKQKNYSNVILNDVKAYTSLQKYAQMKSYEASLDGSILDQTKKHYTEEQIKQINDDWQKYVVDKGYDSEKLLKYYDREKSENHNKGIIENYRNMSQKGLAAADASALSVLMNVTGGVADAAKYIGTEIDSKFNNGDGYIDPNSTNVAKAQAIREGVQKNMGGLGKFLYSTGMSMADFLSTAAISAVPGGQAVGLALLGTSAGVSAANDVIESGGDIDHAVMTGLAAGIAETVFEKLSLEQLKAFKQGNVNSVKNFVENLIKGSFTEGSEEAFTDMANAITDQIINGDMSQLSRQYNEYLANGMSEREAWWKTAVGFGKQTMLDFAGGALSGGVMSGGAMAINLGGAKIDRNKNARQIGEAAMDSEDFDVDSLINAALNTDKGSKAYKMGQSMMRAKNSGNSKSLYNPVNVGILLKLTDEEYRSGKVKDVDQQTQNKKTVKSTVSANNIENENSNTVVQTTKQNKNENYTDIKTYARKVLKSESAENREAIIKLLSPFGTKNENGVVANILENGKKIGVTTVKSIESSSHNHGEDNNKIMLRLKDNTVVSADNIMIHDHKIQQLVKNAAQFETMGAGAYVRAYEDYEKYAGNKADMTRYSEDFSVMYNVGRTGIKYDTFIESGQLRAILRSIGNDAAKQAIFAGNLDSDYRYRHPKNRLLKVDGVKGNVTVADGTEFDMDGNAEVLSLLGSLSKKTGRDIVITNTLNSGIKGQFNPRTGKIYISSEIKSTEMLSIALHEAGHSIKISAPNEWRELEKFVVNYLTSQNKNVSRMIEEQMAVYRASGQILTDDTALEEIVCNTLMSLASDEKALQTAIKSTDKNALQKIASAIKKIVAKIKSWLSDRNAISAEAYKPFMNDVNALMTLAEKFEKAAESGKGVKVEQKNNTGDNSDVKNSSRIKYAIDDKREAYNGYSYKTIKKLISKGQEFSKKYSTLNELLYSENVSFDEWELIALGYENPNYIPQIGTFYRIGEPILDIHKGCYRPSYNFAEDRSEEGVSVVTTKWLNSLKSIFWGADDEKIKKLGVYKITGVILPYVGGDDEITIFPLDYAKKTYIKTRNGLERAVKTLEKENNFITHDENDASEIKYAIDDDYGMFDDLLEGETEEQKAERWHEEFDNYLKYNPEQALMMTYNASAKTAEQAIKVTDVVPEEKRVDRAIKKVWEKYSINANSEKLAFGDFKKALNEYVTDVRDDKISYGESFENLVMACKESLQFSALEDHSFDDFRAELKEICKNGLVINEYEEGEIKEIYGNVARYRNSLFGKCTVRLERNINSVGGNKTGQYIDDIIAELQNKFGEMIPVDMHSLEGLQWFEQIVNKYWQPQYINPYIDGYSEDINTAAIQMAYDMSSAYIAEMSKQIVSNEKADKQQLREITRLARISKDEIQQLAKTKEIAVKESYRKKLADEKERYDKKIKRLNDNLENERMQGLKRAARTEQQIFKLRKQRTQLEEQNKKQRTIIANEFTSIRDNYLEKKRATMLRNRLGRMLNSMSKRLDGKANNNEYIPESLKQPILDVLSSFAVDPGRTKYGKQKAVPGYYGEYRRINEIGSAVTELAQKYSALKKDKTDESDRLEKQQYAFIDIEELPYNSKVNNTLNKLSDLLKGKNVYQLDVYDLEAVVDTMELLDQTLKDAVTVIIDGQKMQFQEAATKAVDEIGKVHFSKDVQRFGNDKLNNVLSTPRELRNAYVATHLDPVRYGKFLSGYHEDSVTYKIFSDLHAGDKKRIRIMESAMLEVQRTLVKYEGKEIESLQKDDVSEFDLRDIETRKRAKITQGVLLAIYLTDKQADGHRHMINDKWNSYTVIPDVGYMNSSITKIKGRNAGGDKFHKIKLTEADIEHIKRYVEENSLLKDLAKSISSVYNEMLPEEINAVSMAKYGKRIATVKNYYPLKVYTDGAKFSDKNFEAEFNDIRMKSRGFTKQREFSYASIMIGDVLNTFQSHINSVSEWCGLLIPIENFKKIYNSGNGMNTLHETIVKKFGGSAEHYIEKLMGDLQKQRDSIDDNMFMKIQRKYMGAVLMLNPGAAVKQMAAFPLANKYFGHINVAKSTVMGAVKGKELCEVYSKYTPYLWYRKEGNGTIVGETSRQAGFYGKATDVLDVMGKMDRYVVNSMLYAAEQHIKKTTNLKPGTEEFYKEVARLYEKVVDESQPNNMITSKPQFVRNNVLKTLSMNAFMSQTMAMGNGIIDSFMEWRARAYDYKTGGRTAEGKAAKNNAAKKFLQHCVGVLESAALLSLLSLISAFGYHKWDDFKDENGDVTFGKITKNMFEYFLDGVFGSFAWGKRIYEFIDSMITGDTYYGLEVMSLSNINDIATDVLNGNYMSLATMLGDCIGLPASNAYRIAKSVSAYVNDIMYGNGNIIISNKGFNNVNFDNLPSMLVTALQKGDKDKAEYYEDMLKEHLMNDKGKSEKEAVDTIKGKIVSILSDTDEVGEIAKFKYNGELEKYESRLDKVVKQGFDSVDVKKAVDKAINNVKTDMKENGINDEESAIDWLMNQGFNEQAAKRIWKATDDSNDSSSQTDSSAFDETSEIDESTKYAYDDLWNALLEGDDELYNEIYKGITTADGKLTDKNLIAKKQKAAVNAMKNASRTDKLWTEYIEAVRGSNPARVKELRNIFVKIYGSWDKAMEALNKYKKKQK